MICMTSISYTCDACGRKGLGFPVWCLNKKTYCGMCLERSRKMPPWVFLGGAITGGIVYFVTDWGLFAAIPWALVMGMVIDKLCYKMEFE